MKTIWVGGLGYAGLPLALALDGAGYEVVGYDIDEAKVRRLQDGRSPFTEIADRSIRAADITYQMTPDAVNDAEIAIICVPTPLTEENEPDVSAIDAIGRTVGRHLTPETTVVLESTVYPGGTRDVLEPAIAETSSLRVVEDYQLGYSPERIVPGQSLDSMTATTKVISATTTAAADQLACIYGKVFDQVHRAPSIEVAEAAKCLENSQRDVNIALINEFVMAMSRLDDIEYEAVLEAAATKWNFQRYEPGLVGGHCIPVDPHYLLYRFERGEDAPSVLEASRAVNERVPERIAALVFDALALRQQSLEDAAEPAVEPGSVVTDGAGTTDETVVLAGLTYKPNSSDVRSAALRSVVDQLRESNLTITGYDPIGDRETISDALDIPVQSDLSVSEAAAVVVLTPHDRFLDLDVGRLADRMASKPAIVDPWGTLGDATADTEHIYRRL